jgi:hypothetical protein
MDRNWNKGWKFFIIVSIPALIFVILFSIIEFLGGFIIMWGYGLVLYFAMLHGKMKRYPLIRLSKFIIVMCLIGIGFFVMSFSPAAMVHQFKVNINKAALIEPDNPVVDELEYQFDLWLQTEPYIEDAYALNYSDGLLIPYQYEDAYYVFRDVNFSEVNFDDLDLTTQLIILNYYITEVIMEWTSDTEVYGSGEYKGTIEEALAVSIDSNWTILPNTDDCDGIAVVTVSFLQHLLNTGRLAGYNVFIGSGKGHWYTVVEPIQGIANFHKPLFLNTWRYIHVWYYFNQEETKLGQPIMDTIQDLWLLDEEDEDFKNILELIRGQYLLIFGVVLLVSLIGVLLVNYPRERDDDILLVIKEQRETRKEKINNNKIIAQKWNPIYWLAWLTYGRVGNPFQKPYQNYWVDVIFTTILLYIAAIGTFLISSSPYPQVYAAIVIFIIVFLLDTDIFVKGKDLVKNITTSNKREENHI